MKKTFLFAALTALLCACAQPAPQELSDLQTLKSPDGSLEMTVGLAQNGAPTYSLEKDGNAVVLPSRKKAVAA